MTQNDLEQAKTLETTDPKTALSAYRRLRRRAFKYYPSIILAGLASPFFATVLATASAERFPDRERLIHLIFGVLGFVVAPAMHLYRRYGRLERPGAQGVVFSALFGVIALMAPNLILVICIIIAGLLSLPFAFVVSLVTGHSLATLPPTYVAIISIPFLLLTIAYFLNPSPFRSPFPLRKMLFEAFVAVRYEYQIIIFGVVTCALPWYLQTLWEEGYSSTVVRAGLVIGLLQGISLVRVPRDAELDFKTRIGICRCLIRLGRLTEARVCLEWIPSDANWLTEDLIAEREQLEKQLHELLERG
jgi:hypothetical protein